MKRLSIWKRTGFGVRTAGILAAICVFAAGVQDVWAAPSSGSAVSDNVVVREEAVDGAQIASLDADQEVTITGESEASDGNVWYQITFEGTGGEQTGWVRSDLIETSEEEESADGQDTDEQTEDTSAAAAVRVETAGGYVDLTDVPEEQAALVSDRFISAVCELEEGTVRGYQLADADELVADDADVTAFYYLYGTDDRGEEGWYVYDAGEGILQKSILNMNYSIPTETTETIQTQAETSGGSSVGQMIFGGLCLICLFLLVLVIVFSARYRRLRNLLEEETGESGEMPVSEKQQAEESEPEEREDRKEARHQKKDDIPKTENSSPDDGEDGCDLPDDDSYDVYDLDELDQILAGEKKAESLKKPEQEDTPEKADFREDDPVISREDAELERILREESEKMFRLNSDQTGNTVPGDIPENRNEKKLPEDQKRDSDPEDQKQKKDEIPDLPEDIEFVDDGIEDEDLEFL